MHDGVVVVDVAEEVRGGAWREPLQGERAFGEDEVQESLFHIEAADEGAGAEQPY